MAKPLYMPCIKLLTRLFLKSTGVGWGDISVNLEEVNKAHMQIITGQANKRFDSIACKSLSKQYNKTSIAKGNQIIDCLVRDQQS